jgi:DNA ligase-1
LRIGLADKTLVVALAHAIVLRDLGKSAVSWLCSFPTDQAEGKNTPHGQIAAKLEQGADIVKSVYRFVLLSRIRLANI